jgi:hypothetical protein
VQVEKRLTLAAADLVDPSAEDFDFGGGPFHALRVLCNQATDSRKRLA